MGITRECFEIYARLVQSNYLDWDTCSVIELGAQTVHFEDRQFFLDWAKRIQISEDAVKNFKAGVTAQYVHNAFGHSYKCIEYYDCVENVDTLKWNINDISCPVEHQNSYDLVTNFGTSEHLINQTNAFKLMHDLVKVGGILFNLLPMARMNHGFFNYNPCFFECLARANRYKILGIYTSKDLIWSQQQELVPYHGKIPADHEYIFCILRRTSADPFRNPNQMFLNGKIA